MMRVIDRIGRLFLALFLLVAAIAPAVAAEQKLRIGVQKYGTLIVLQASGALEKRLAPLGYRVEWVEFPAGPPLLEALNAGTIEFGTTGESPPVFAQAAGIPFVYAGVEPAAPAGEAILVPKGSPLRSVADLKGKRVAFFKGSNVHYFIVAALAKAGLTLGDIEPVYLAPADARAAFERGSVDAWGIWDPYYAAGQAATEARVLTDGTGLVSNYQYYLASRALSQAKPELIKTILAEIAAADAWAVTRQKEVAALLAPRTGLPTEIIEVSLSRLSFGAQPLNAEIVASQQRIADTFHQLGLIPKPITISDAVWSPQS
jgi:sulfonate transport system substrate-binding protein